MSDPHHVLVPRTAFAQEHPCVLHAYHSPAPVVTEYHHSHPVYLQNRLWGRIVDGPDTWLCSNCHEAVHAWIYWLLGERRQPPNIGRNAKAEAERTVAWYRTALEAKSPPPQGYNRAVALCVHRHRLPSAQIPCLECLKEASEQ
jgi:hypothetical protein